MSLAALFVTQWYPPEPVTVPASIAQSLRSRGIEPIVLTAHPNYPDGVVHEGYDARTYRHETIDGVAVHRSPVLASHDRSAVRRILNYLSWAFSASRAILRTDAEVTLVYSSPATAAIPAIWRRRRRGTPYVLLVQDVWPDSIFASGFLNHRWVRRIVDPLVDRFVQSTYRGAASILVISPGALDLLESRGVPAARLSLVYNWAESAAEQPVERHDELRNLLGLGAEELLVTYAGNHGPAQALDVLIEGFRLLGPESGCHLLLVGDGIDKPQLMEQARDLEHVHFHAPVPVAQMPWIAAGSDALVVSLADSEIFRVTMPSKVQSILAAGVPALVVAPGDSARVVSEAGAGVCAAPGDSRAVARAVQQLDALSPQARAEMGERGRSMYLECMSEEVGGQRLAEVLRRVAAGPRSGRST